jgi:hypothetical protein
MKLEFTLICAIVAVFAVTGNATEKQPLPTLEPGQHAELRAWLDEHGTAPELYVASKFKDHDIVFLGEYHRIRHDVLLVKNLIPILYRSGVYYLGLEFLRAWDQVDIDSLLSADVYDEALANRLFWNEWPFWGFQEYVDILQAAWRLNKSLPPDARQFRVVGLNARMDWSHVWTKEDRANPEILKKVFLDGDPDEVMAGTIEREILSKGEKALIYSGINHAYTVFQQPIVDEEKGELVRLNSTRMGNRIYERIGDRSFTIFLHSPWPAVTGYADPYVYPVDGVIDALFAAIPPEKQRLGFDVKGSPFGKLLAETALWAYAAQDFRLEMYCDGWIFQMPLSQYKGVTVIPGWFNEANRLEAIAQIANPDPRVKRRDRTVKELMDSMTSDTDFKRRFMHFH